MRRAWWAGQWVDLDSAPVTDPAVYLTGPRATITVISGASAYTPGTWVEVYNATSTDIDGLAFQVNLGAFLSAADSSMMLEVNHSAPGPADGTIWGAATIGYTGNQSIAAIPGRIPAGRRVYVRIAGTQGLKSLTYYVWPIQLGVDVGAPFVLNLNPAGCRGVVNVTSGASGNWGAWTQIEASTPDAVAAFSAQIQGAASATITNDPYVLVQIGYGAPGSEVPVGAGSYHFMTTEQIVPRHSTFVTPQAASIPAGSRIAVRAMGSAAAPSAFDLVMSCAPPA